MRRVPRVLLALLVVALALSAVTTALGLIAPGPLDRYTGAGAFPAGGQYHFEGPDVAATAYGTFWVVDSSRDRLLEVNTVGAVKRTLGGSGSGNGRFADPSGIAVGADGKIYVADESNARVQVFNSSGDFILKFGSYGTGDGQFRGLQDVAADSDGNIWTVDSDNNCVQKFSSAGVFLLKQGGVEGNGDGQFDYPTGIACMSDDRVVVADRDNHRVQVLDSDGVFQLKFGSLGSTDNQLTYPTRLDVDGSDRIYVTDSNNHWVKRFDFNVGGGDYVYAAKVGGDLYTFGDWWTDPLLDWPTGVGVDKTTGKFAVVDAHGLHFWNSVTSFNSHYLSGGFGPSGGGLEEPDSIDVGANGTVWVGEAPGALRKFTYSNGVFTLVQTRGGYGEDFWSLTDVSCDATGNAFVLDSARARVIRFDAADGSTEYWGSPGSGDGQFDDATGIGVHGNKVYVSDSGNDRVQIFDTEGNYLDSFGEAETVPALPGQFDHVSDVAADDDYIYVSDYGDARVKKYSATAPYDFVLDMGGWGSEVGSLMSPHSIDVDVLGNIYVADDAGARVEKFAPNGEWLVRIGRLGSGANEFTEPSGVAVDSNGTVFVADAELRRVSAHNPDTRTSTKVTPASTVVGYAGGTNLVLRLLNADGVDVAGQPLTVQRSFTGGAPWATVDTTTSAAAGLTYPVSGVTRKTWYRTQFSGGALFAPSVTMSSALVAPRVKSLTKPVAPASARAGARFTAYGYLEPKHAAGAKSVRILKYRYEGGRWKPKGYVSAVNYNSGSKTKYVATMSLTAGKWRLWALAPSDSLHAETKSASYDSITIK